MFCPYKKDAFNDKYYITLATTNCRHLPPYSCRHTIGTILALAGVPDAIAQEIMRHGNYKTTRQYYTHIDDEKALDALNQLFNGSDDP